MSRVERVRAAAYAAVLLWLNAYVCRDWLYHPTAWMNSLHGSWAAVARLSDGWLQPSWWPFWDMGMPAEFAAPPLVPVMAAGIAGLRHVSHLMAVQTVSAIFYCAAPVALFLLAWGITRSAGYAFLAGLFYSVLSPAQLLATDGVFSWAAFLAPHRFNLQAMWDETPRCAALTFLLLFLLLLARAVEARRAAYIAASAVALALTILASPYAVVAAVVAVLCLLTAMPGDGWTKLWCTAGAAVLAFALAARWLPPSVWLAMGASTAAGETWSIAQVQNVTRGAVVWFSVEFVTIRYVRDWRLRFFAFWTFAVCAVTMLASHAGLRILPQASRFRIEMEAAIALAVVFGLRPLLERLPWNVRGALLLVALWLAGVQVVQQRRLAKDVLYPADVATTIEYRTAQRVARELPGTRVLLPGSIAAWANAFTDVLQVAGGFGGMAYNGAHQRALASIYRGDARSLLLLEAYGVRAVVVSGPESKEYWKPFAHPSMFEGGLPVLWSEEGVTAYRVPRDPPPLTWKSRNHFQVRVEGSRDEAISIPVSYHAGWHAEIAGHSVAVTRDAFGLMSVRLEESGVVTVELRYDGGWELRLCGWLSLGALLVAAALVVRR
ncbi:MAG: hypothetical protein ABI806_04595 [Candidatus Solibacter sp.]